MKKLLLSFIALLITLTAIHAQSPAIGITVAGGNGQGSAANQLNWPSAVFIDKASNIYVADGNNGRIQKWLPGATSGITVAGGNGIGAAANQLNGPMGIFLDNAGNIYVADYHNNRVQKWARGATSGITVAGGNGSGNAANQLSLPVGLWVDTVGNIYVADYSNNRVQKWGPGDTTGTTVIASGGTSADQLDGPWAIFLDNNQNIYVASELVDDVQKWAPGATSGTVVAGVSRNAGSAANLLSAPDGIFVDSAGNIYVSDANNDRIQKFTPGATNGITVAGGNGDGGAANQFRSPSDVFLDAGGNIYVVDDINFRVQEFFNKSVSITTPVAALYHPSQNISLNYTVSSTFAQGNTFTLQLSNSSGDFTNSINLSTITDTVAGTFNITLPAQLHIGCFYKFRIIASNPSSFGIPTNKFIIEDSLPAKANFQTAANGFSVAYLNTSNNANVYQWYFGDGGQSSGFNPVHAYSTYGPFVQTLIASKSCNTVDGADTVSQIIAFKGISGISPDFGGNNGIVSVTISGGPFISGTKFWLAMSGQAPIYGDTLRLTDAGHIVTDMDLRNKQTGGWDVYVELPSGDTFTLANGFIIAPVTASKLGVTINGPDVLREGVTQIYTITVTSYSDEDMIGVPLFIQGLPPNTGTQIINEDFINIRNALFFKDTLGTNWDSIPAWSNFVDPTTNTSMYGCLLYKVPAYSSITINATFNVPSNIPTADNYYVLYPITVTAAQPLYYSWNGWNDSTPGLRSCFTSLIPDVAETALGISGNGAQNIAGCDNAIYNATGSIFNLVANQFNHLRITGVKNNNIALDFLDLSFGLFDAANNCLKSTTGHNVAGGTASVALTKLAVKAMQDEVYFADCVGVLSDQLTTPQPSQIVLSSPTATLSVIVGNSWDPNTKYGPGGGSSQHFINGAEPLLYTVGFENDTEASLPAQTVRIIDTLDMTKLDLSTFKFTSLTVGDSSISLTTLPSHFFTQIDFTQTRGVICRITGAVDSNGVIYIDYNSIDPHTGQQINSPSAGFLPPDIISPQGQGSISYQIKKLPSVASGGFVQNHAEIYFDNNQPVVTGVWQNIFDTIKPVGQLNTPKPVNDSDFALSWSGSDVGSGVYYYDIYVRDDTGGYYIFDYHTPLLADTFYGNFGQKYTFFVLATDSAGNVQSDTSFANVVTGLNNLNSNNIILEQNTPNPFNGETQIEFYLPKDDLTELSLMDIYGRNISTLLKGQLAAGWYRQTFYSNTLSAGIYFYQLSVNGNLVAKKMIVQ